jgi:hypothetical protein
MKKLLYTFLAVSIIFSACKKEVIIGCTNPTATNYYAYAEEDDGSCRYEGTVIFQLDNCLPNGIEDPTHPTDNYGIGLMFQIGDASFNNFGEPFGLINMYENSNYVYNCNPSFLSNTADKKWDLSEENNKSLTWRAIDVFGTEDYVVGNIYDSGSFVIERNECEEIGIYLNSARVMFHLDDGVGDEIYNTYNVSSIYFYIKEANSQEWIWVREPSNLWITTEGNTPPSFCETSITGSGIKYTHRLLSNKSTTLNWKATDGFGTIYDSGNFLLIDGECKMVGVDLQ